MKLADRISRLGTETAFDVLAKVNELKAQGKNIVSFSIGEPDFNTPENIKKAGKDAIDRNETHYKPANGILELREVIAQKSFELRGVKVDPAEVVVTPGAKPILFHTMHALVNEGDEVIYVNPGFPIYESVINFLNAKPVPLPLVEEKEFSCDIDTLKSLITKKTKLLIINSPHNPTGGSLSKTDLEAIAELAIKHDFYVMSDEVYHRFSFDTKFESISSIPGMKERTIIVDGCSKTYAMTGWRIGWGIMPQELAKVVTRMIINSDSCTAAFTQYAAIEALRGDQTESYKMAEEFKARRDLIVKLLNDIKGVKCLKAKGAFYVFPNVTEACKNLGFKDSRELQDYLLYNAGVAVLSRTCFGSKNIGEKDEYIRLSYATSREQIIEGLRRMKEAIENKE